MKLYGYWRSSASYRIRIVLALKGVDYDYVPVNLLAGDQREHDHVSRQPQGLVPAFETSNGAILTQSLAIAEYLDEVIPEPALLPKDAVARGMARSMVAEMHSSYQALRSECPMNVRKRFEGFTPSEACRQDILRILGLWAEARSRFGSGGPFLFGTFGAADVYFAPVVSRFISYQIPVPGFAAAYMQAVWEHEWLQTWIEASDNEEWVIEQYETIA